MEKICYNCKFARLACAKNKVACGYAFNEHKMDYQKTLEDFELESVVTGWGYMKRDVQDLEGKHLGSGIMTNNVIVFDKNFHCKHFKEREER